jgi:HEAT repeat protein
MRYALMGVLALAGCGCGQSQPTLAGGKPVSHWIQTLKKPDPKERRQAVRHLGNVGAMDEAVLPALIGALWDRDGGVREEAIFALVKFGPDAQEAVPRLARMQRQDPSARVRASAGRALRMIQKP